MFLTVVLTAVVFLVACSESITEGDSLQNKPSEYTEAGLSSGTVMGRLQQDTEFASTLHPLLLQNCGTCHGTGGSASPLIAHQDAGIAQSEIIDNQKVSFANPGNSRIVSRLRDTFHYCWSVCDADALQLELAISEWATLTLGNGTVQPPVQIISSQILTLADGILGTGTPRYNDDVIAFYEFKEGAGTVAKDTSGISPAIDLTLEGTTWAPGQGIEINSGIAVGTQTASRKLYDIIANGANATQEYSIEAWVVPANVTQEGPARIVTYSTSTRRRNFTMGQATYNYIFRNRSDSPDISSNGTPGLSTNQADQILKTNQQHVVMTFSQQNGRKIYVNGSIKGVENVPPSSLSNWSPNHTFAIGNEVSNNRLFMGIVQLVAIHKTALTPSQVMQNYDAGVGEKFILKFDVSQLVEQPDNFIQFEVSELDKFSYLFNKPIFLTNTSNGFQIKNIQISVNGQIPVAGQTWRNINTFVSQNGQSLNTLAAVIAKDAGPELDQFSVVFETLGNKKTTLVQSELPVVPQIDIADTAPRVGLRTFEQITHSMAALTGVDPNLDNIRQTYLDLQQQLPSLPNINGFLASHQVGIAKLALEYCDTMINSPNLRSDFFGVNAFNFNAPVVDAFSVGQTDLIIGRLVDNMFGVVLTNQPDNILVKDELNSLITDLTINCNSAAACDATRTQSVVKATCSAVLGSAAITIQ